MCSGAFLFDLNTSSLSLVAEKVVDELLSKNEIGANDREGLLRALLMRRRSVSVSQHCQKMSKQAWSAHPFCPFSQSGGALVTETGDIQMQTFSVTNKVQTSVLCPSRVTTSRVLTLPCCPSRRETAPTTWRPRWSSQVRTWTPEVPPVCSKQALNTPPVF